MCCLGISVAACGGGGSGGGGGDKGGDSSTTDGRGQLVTQTLQFSVSGPVDLRVGETFVNVLTGGPGTGAVVYLSASPDVASVDSNGMVTAIAIGQAIISARKSADETYAEAAADYVVNVRPREDEEPNPITNRWPTSWQTFQSDAQHTGFVPVTLDPRRFSWRWTHPMPETSDDSQQVVADIASVYVSKSMQRVALDAFSGRPRWGKTMISGGLAPLLAGDQVYFQNTNSDDSYLSAYDSQSGSLLYQVPYGNQWSEFTAPVIEGNVLYAGAGTYGGLKAFDASDGAVLWHFPDVDCRFFSPTLSNKYVIVYSGGTNPRLALLNKNTGSELANIADPDSTECTWFAGNNSSPVLSGEDSVLYSQNGRLIHFDLVRRSIAWQLLDGNFAQPAVKDEEFFLVNDGHFEIRNLQNGSLLWRLSNDSNSYRNAVLVTENLAFVQGDSQVDAIDLGLRKVVWSYPAGGALSMSNGMLYISTQSSVIAIDLLGDGDGNGLLDVWETRFGVTNPASDDDLDGLTAVEEQASGLLPHIADFDGDSLSDGDEVKLYHTDPFKADTDSDDLTDADEIHKYGTDPRKFDSDDDRLNDSIELALGLDPNHSADATADFDGDGFVNRLEIHAGSDWKDSGDVPPSQWTMYQGNARHNGYVPVELDSAKFGLRWTYTASAAMNDAIEVDGKVFVTAKSGAKYVKALNANTGEELWHRDVVGDKGIVGTPQRSSAASYGNGQIYIHVNGYAESGRSDAGVHAFNANSGALTFTRLYPAARKSSDSYKQVTLYGDRACFTYDDMSHACIDALNGAMRWRTLLPFSSFQNEYPIYRDKVYRTDGGLYSLDFKTGAVASTVSDLHAWGPPIIGTMDNAILTAEYGIKSIDLGRSTVKWFIYEGDYIRSIAAGNNQVFAIVKGSLVAYNEQNGARLWQWQPEGDSLETNLVVTASHVFVGSKTRTYAFAINEQKLDWTYGHSGGLSYGGENSLLISSGSTLHVINLD